VVTRRTAPCNRGHRVPRGSHFLPPGSESGGAAAPPSFPQGLTILEASKVGSLTDIPWTLNRADESEQRIYLTTQNFECSFPEGVSVVEGTESITLKVHGKPAAGPCTQQLTMFKTYVQLPNPINARKSLGAHS
jgi:hypothetical protein